MSRLKALRLEKGYTQKELSRLTGISQSTLSALEREKRRYRIHHVITLSVAPDTSADYLLGRVDEKEPYPRNEANEKGDG